MFEVIRNGQHNNRFVYYGTPGANSASWYTFTKPPGINFINVLLVGGGGGGGAGRSGSTNQNRLGGGGGSSGTITTATFLAATLPDSFYISPGCGGAGGAPTANSGNAGIGGNASIIAVGPDLTNTALIIAHAAGGLGGNGVVAVSNPPAAAAVSGSTVTNMPLIDIAISYNVFGGAIGGAIAGNQNGAALVPLNTTNLTITGGGGAGSASTTTAYTGHSWANTAYTSNVNPRAIGAAGKSDGFVYNLTPFISLGGAGGTGNLTSTASSGGDGAYGAGGGGGGGGLTAGSGGNGGPGMVIITCY